ncbi:MAG: vWA domain-containing protein [Polyangiaceae bacterium]
MRRVDRGSILRRAWTNAATALVASALTFAACGGESHPPLFQPLQDASAGTGGAPLIDAGINDGPPSADAELCGNQLIPVVIDRPNLYFVLDRSGSMSDPQAGGLDKYQSARVAIADVLRTVGHRVRYGAAVFPGSSGPIPGCESGVEVFPTQDGDPVTFAEQQKDGPVLQALLNTLAKMSPQGGTPTSATLTALAPTLTALTGKTFVVLATDGGPNCNLATSCAIQDCMPNIEGAVINGVPCDSVYNCCAPNVPGGGPLNCVDGPASEAAVAALAAQGIPTYVVGMPGSEVFAKVLDKLAVAGLTARATSPKYYAVSDATELSDALKQIGVTVAISCTIELDFEPEDADLVNVYFDKSVLPGDATDGWQWAGSKTIEILGPACDKLKSGDVYQLQVVGGCPTQVR